MSFESTLHLEHGLDLWRLFQTHLPEPNLMARGARQTRLEVPPSLHHSNLNRAAVIAKAIKGSVKKDSADVKDTLGRQKIQSGRGCQGHGRASQVEKLNGLLSWWCCLSLRTYRLPQLVTPGPRNRQPQQSWLGDQGHLRGTKKLGVQKERLQSLKFTWFLRFLLSAIGGPKLISGTRGSVAFHSLPSSLAVLVSDIQFYHFFKTCHSVFQCFTSIIPISVVYLWLGTTIISGMIISLAILFH